MSEASGVRQEKAIGKHASLVEDVKGILEGIDTAVHE